MSNDSSFIPSPTSSNSNNVAFQTQLDVTVFAISPFQLILKILDRTSHGGIEPHTLAAGYVLVENMRPSTLGALRVEHAVRQLHAFSPWQGTLLFGFGIKHIIRRLADSAEGVSLVALCACASDTFGIKTAAEILMKLFVRTGVLCGLTPSQSQWHKLVQACAGAMSGTCFSKTVEELTRPYWESRQPYPMLAPPPDVTADALYHLKSVANGTTARIYLVGGPACGWIAAIANWLLGLAVEITGPSGETLYSLGGQQQHDVRVSVTYDTSRPDALVLRQSSFALPRAAFIRRQDTESADLVQYGRVQWSSILRYTFRADIERLLSEDLDGHVGTAIGSAARIFTAKAMESVDCRAPQFADEDNAFFPTSQSCGVGFVETARSWLPELLHSSALVAALNICTQETKERASSLYEESMRRISEACKCRRCCKTPASEESCICLPALVTTISFLVLDLARVEPASGSPWPTTTGLRLLYDHVIRQWDSESGPRGKRPLFKSSPKKEEVRKRSFLDLLLQTKRLGPMRTALRLYTGLLSGTESSTPRASAISTNGICVYMDALTRIDDDPETIFKVHVIAGSVQWENDFYSKVVDEDHAPESVLLSTTVLGRSTPQLSKGYPCKSIKRFESINQLRDLTSPHIKAELVLSVPRDCYTDVLQATYRISTPRGAFSVSPFDITARVRKALPTISCANEPGSMDSGATYAVAEGEGHIMPPMPFDSVLCTRETVLLRILPNKAVARWVALSQNHSIAGHTLSPLSSHGDPGGFSHLGHGSLFMKTDDLVYILQSNESLNDCQQELRARAQAYEKHTGRKPRTALIVKDLGALAAESVVPFRPVPRSRATRDTDRIASVPILSRPQPRARAEPVLRLEWTPPSPADSDGVSEASVRRRSSFS